MFDTLQPAAYACSFAFFGPAIATTALRIYSRKCIIKSFGWDDWWIRFVFVFNAGQQAMFCLFLHYGGGLHREEVDEANLPTLLKLLFAEEIQYIWMQFIIKHAFLQFYLRLANRPSFTYSVYVTMVLNAVIAVALWLLYCLQCRPLAAFWNAAAYPGAKCLDTPVTYYVPVAFNILTDFIILALPIRPLWNIQASVSRRLGVIAVITVGGVAVVVSCLRLIVLHEFAVNPDFTYTLGKMVIISAAELDVAIMAANAPSLKAVWLKHVTGSIGSYVSTVRLASLQKKQQAAAPESEASVPRYQVRSKDGVFRENSSTNNLVERSDSGEN
ncbi:hypothetical protein BDW74DRAFT_181149 [Aspergillus multicolor]|uniref:uncharacterized protein n=1 Tax=Aspergillus multicolor TaxID=41759 RepID=UPI003CCE4AC7